MRKVFVIFFVLLAFGEARSQDLPDYGDDPEESGQTKGRHEAFRKLSNKSRNFLYAGEKDSARATIDQALRIATDSHSDSLMARSYVLLGMYFSIAGDLKQSLEFLFKALAIHEKSRNNTGISVVSKEISVVFKQLKNYPEALKYLRKAEAFTDQAARNIPTTYNRLYSHMAETFLGLHQTDSALRYIQLANEATRKDDDAYGFARMLYIFASVYRQKNEPDLAESYYKRCIAFSDSNRIALPLINAMADYSDYLLNTGKPVLAKQYAWASLDVARQSGNKLGIIQAASLLRMAYDSLKSKDSAYYYAQLKDMYRDSVFNEQQLIQIQNLTFTKQINDREEEARVARQKEQHRHNLQYAGIAIVLITFIILFLVLSRSVVVSAGFIEFFGVLGLLAVFEFINLFIHPYLDKVTNHSPVLMLVILIAIGALLVPLHHKLEKWITNSMVEKNKKIRLEAAKKTIARLEKEK
ncbi:MAG TPA: hypothetical protein VD993_17620 [Chitinophagaceae bacterium]|nr:hypothetical protein [Chitinophagaceae bacterium]